MTDAEIPVVMQAGPVELAECDQETAHAAGLLRRSINARGLSMGDRACLALAQIRNLQAFMTVRVWKKQKSFDVLVIR